MSKKKNIKFVSLVTMLCVVIAYFAALSPTTAYYYKSDEKNVDVNFSLLDVNQTVSEVASDVNLKAATKFYDFSEYLFDEVCYTQTVTLENSGDIDAKIYVLVDVPEADLQNGLRYFIIKSEISGNEESETNEVETTASSSETTAVSEVTETSVKTEIEDTLSAFDGAFADGISFSDADAILNSYNAQFTSFNDAPLIKKGESITFKIVFWAEYDAVSNALFNETASFSYAPTVTVKASQNTADAAPVISQSGENTSAET